MSFINTDSGVCLSPTGETSYIGCDFIIDELGRKYILTEGAKRIIPEGDCLPFTIFDCDKIERIVVDSGKFVTIINTCTLPLTITGFKNDDPERFSIFQYPEYSGYAEYNTGNTEELPFTIEPFQRVNINTFFHPLYSELVSGNAGTIENRTGDKFESNISILPGFEVLNCKEDPITSILWWEENTDCDLVLMNDSEKSFNPAGQWFQESGDENFQVRESIFYSYTEDAQYFEEKGLSDVAVKYDSKATSSYCSPKFRLEGEFICYQEKDIDWLSNTGNYVREEKLEIPQLIGSYCIPFWGPFSKDIAGARTVQDGYETLSLLGETIKQVTDLNPKWEANKSPSWSGALGAFDEMIEVITGEGGDNNYQNIINKVFPETGVNAIVQKIPEKDGSISEELIVVKSSFDGSRPGSSFTFNVPGSAFLTGLNFKIDASDEVKQDFEIKDSSIYFGKTQNGEKMVMLIAESGDINQYGFCNEPLY